MALTTLSKILAKAQKEGYAVGAFNVENMEMVQAVIGVAEELQSPVILQTTPSTLQYAGCELFFSIINALTKKTDIPVAIHLDHGNSFEIVSKAFREGYTSVMIDGSKLSREENIQLTKSVVKLCSPSGVSVEAELGCVGGKEDEHSDNNELTQPEEARFFASETKVDALAVAIGTAHGLYKTTPDIDVDRLKEIRKNVDIPLVLHGTSGVPDDVVKECIKNGICKVNYATDLRVAFTKGVLSTLKKNGNIYDPKQYFSAGSEEVKRYVASKMKICGCAGKA